MDFYLAPLEGITGYLYRNAVFDMFEGQRIRKYFTPFFMPHEKKAMTAKEINELLPEHHEGYTLIPQLLSKSSVDYFRFEKEVMALGYQEINLNLGCPSKTVVSKGRGSGFLQNPEGVDHFLEEIFSHNQAAVSVKTRLGMSDPEEFAQLLEIYNKYPLRELILHPRVGKEFYKGHAHREWFSYAVKHSKNPLCYNGDLYTIRDYQELLSQFPAISVPKSQQHPEALTKSMAVCTQRQTNFCIMIGRGMIANPGLIRELSGGSATTKEEYLHFLLRLENDYTKAFSGETPVLFKMKEQWSFMQQHFQDQEKLIHKLLKTRHLSEYHILLRQILQDS